MTVPEEPRAQIEGFADSAPFEAKSYLGMFDLATDLKPSDELQWTSYPSSEATQSSFQDSGPPEFSANSASQDFQLSEYGIFNATCDPPMSFRNRHRFLVGIYNSYPDPELITAKDMGNVARKVGLFMEEVLLWFEDEKSRRTELFASERRQAQVSAGQFPPSPESISASGEASSASPSYKDTSPGIPSQSPDAPLPCPASMDQNALPLPMPKRGRPAKTHIKTEPNLCAPDAKRKKILAKYPCPDCGNAVSLERWAEHVDRKHFPASVWECPKINRNTGDPCSSNPNYRPAYRHDNFATHLKGEHDCPDSEVVELKKTCKFEVTDFFHRVCGFCDKSLRTRDESIEHIKDHFRDALQQPNPPADLGVSLWKEKCGSEHKLQLGVNYRRRETSKPDPADPVDKDNDHDEDGDGRPSGDSSNNPNDDSSNFQAHSNSHEYDEADDGGSGEGSSKGQEQDSSGFYSDINGNSRLSGQYEDGNERSWECISDNQGRDRSDFQPKNNSQMGGRAYEDIIISLTPGFEYQRPQSSDWSGPAVHSISGLISPPDSRQTSDNNSEPPPPIQTCQQPHGQSILSIQKAISSGSSNIIDPSFPYSLRSPGIPSKKSTGTASSTLSAPSAVSSAMDSPYSNRDRIDMAPVYLQKAMCQYPGLASNGSSRGNEGCSFAPSSTEDFALESPTWKPYRPVPSLKTPQLVPAYPYPRSPTSSQLPRNEGQIEQENKSQIYNSFPYPPLRRPSIPSTISLEKLSSEEFKEKGRCTYADCGRAFKDLKAHMLTHQKERPEKCPIQTCDYHIKGFSRKYDKNRHALTHYKGTMVCGFCPGSCSVAEKSFNRADVFKRHLTSVHAVEKTPPNSRKKTLVSVGINGSKKLSDYAPDSTGKCLTCSSTFSNAQDFYDHFDDCVLRDMLYANPSVAAKTKRLAEVQNDQNALDILRRHGLPSTTNAYSVHDNAEDDHQTDSDDDVDSDYGVRDKTSRKSCRDDPRESQGLTHAKGGIILSRKPYKKWIDYPASWGCAPVSKDLPKRSSLLLDEPHRLSKDTMPDTDFVNVKSNVTDFMDLDAQIFHRAGSFYALNGKKGPLMPGGLTIGHPERHTRRYFLRTLDDKDPWPPRLIKQPSTAPTISSGKSHSAKEESLHAVTLTADELNYPFEGQDVIFDF